MRVSPALRQELERLFEVVPHRSRSDELCIVCPQPGCGDQSGNRSINLKTGKTFCFRCNQGGNVVAWASRIGIKISGADEDGGYFDPRTLEIDLKGGGSTLLPSVKAVNLPEGFTTLADNPKSVYTKFIRKMAERKNLRLDDFVEAGAGFTKTDPLWEPFCIFPVVEHRTVVYYQGRTYTDEPDKPTKKFPSRSVVEYGAKYWIYGIDDLRTAKVRVAVVVESILNVLSLRWKLRELGMGDEFVPVAVFKHRVSREQWYKLAQFSRLDEICLLFDHDATALSWADAERFTGRCQLSIAEMPLGEGNKKNDPNDDVEAAILALENRVAFKSVTAMARKVISGDDDQRGWVQTNARVAAVNVALKTVDESSAEAQIRVRREAFRRRFRSTKA